MYSYIIISVINLSRHRDPQWNLRGCLWVRTTPSHGSPRNSKKWQIVHHRFAPPPPMWFSPYFSVFAPYSWHRGSWKNHDGLLHLLEEETYGQTKKITQYFFYTLGFKSLKPYLKSGTRNVVNLDFFFFFFGFL